MVKKKLALFGGTFDPIHIGHTSVAAWALEHIGAEKIIFIPAKQSPLRKTPPNVNDKNRIEMITLAIAKTRDFEVSNYELNKPMPSYTLDTVQYFKNEYGNDTTIYWLIGSDNINDLPHWYGITELIDKYNLAVMYRAGFKRPDFSRFVNVWGNARIKKLEQNVILTPLVNVSSTEIRERLAAGLDVSDMLHPAVADYIRRHNLYQGVKS
jgi:nicotinate-nucleotide adenylyltransferase